MRAPSLVALVPLVITVVVLVCVVVSTTVTVRRDRRMNAVLAVRWAETLRRRRAAAVTRRPLPLPIAPPPLLVKAPVAAAAPKRDAA